MNLGQRIYQKSQKKQSIESEISEIECIIAEINLKEEHISDIDLNLPFQEVYRILKDYIQIVDEKLNEIQEKYLRPNGLFLQYSIRKEFLEIWPSLLIENEKESLHDCEDLTDKWNDYLYTRLSSILNISEIAVLLGAFWYIQEYDNLSTKIISTNKDT